MIEVLPYDAHNHVHMGPTSLEHANLNACLRGMACMSTHPRDFPVVLQLYENDPAVILPCIGVHPWFLHELTEQDWQRPTDTDHDEDQDDVHGGGDHVAESSSAPPRWICEMEQLLLKHPNMPVGEIGLDNFHFNPITKDLTSPIDTQVKALELQLSLAVKYQRPVSVHCVRAMGKIMDTFSKIRKQYKALPPKIYFHAFGGKAATVTQLFRSLEKRPNNKTAACKVYFGFAPIVNFESQKTRDVIEAVGLERLVLETDHEDAAKVESSMKLGVEVISKALGVTPEELIRHTNKNAKDLYGLDWNE